MITPASPLAGIQKLMKALEEINGKTTLGQARRAEPVLIAASSPTWRAQCRVQRALPDACVRSPR